MYVDTKQMIARQLFEMLRHKKLEDVTIKALVDACHISRQTFYYHFRDLIDVLEWGTGEAVRQDLEASLQARSQREVIRLFVARVLRNREVTRSLMRSDSREQFERIMTDGFRTYLRELFRQKWPDPALPAGDMNALLDFYTFGLMGVILKYGCAGDVEEDVLVDRIDRIVSGEMKRQLTGG